ncbi:succinylglutamate desuccinylase [Marinobacter sp. 1Y8]
MAPHLHLFDGEPDWLSHTLIKGGQSTSKVTVTLDDGTSIQRLDTGVLEVTPVADSGERLIVSAGVHGNETAPIEVLNALVSELVRGDWTAGLPMLLILGHPAAMVNGTRFLDFNLNRLFSGAHAKPPYAGTPEAARAAYLEEVCTQFSAPAKALIHYDLHTAIRPSHREKFALYPFVPGRTVPPSQCDFMLEADVPTLLLQHKSGTTFSSFSSTRLNAESFTIELGKVQPFGKNDLSRFKGIEQALRRLFSGQPAPALSEAQTAERAVFEVVHEIINTGEHFSFHVPDDVANFTAYPPGTLIWEDDTTQYRVGDAPESIIFPNRDVPIGQRVGLLVREQA